MKKNNNSNIRSVIKKIKQKNISSLTPNECSLLDVATDQFSFEQTLLAKNYKFISSIIFGIYLKKTQNSSLLEHKIKNFHFHSWEEENDSVWIDVCKSINFDFSKIKSVLEFEEYATYDLIKKLEEYLDTKILEF